VLKLLPHNRIIRFNISILIFSFILIFGSAYRYLRLYNADLNNVPYILEIVLAIIVIIKLLHTRLITINRIDLLFLVLLISICISFFILSIRFGLSTQVPFVATYLLPISIYYYVRYNSIVTTRVIHLCLCIFVLVSFIFLSLEFFTVNYIGIPIFPFASHWDSVGVEGYHASKQFYAMLGLKVRPWGLMAMPQASGTVFASLFIYFLSKHFKTAAAQRTKLDFLFITVSFLGVFISGSRTAYVIMVILILILFRKRNAVIFLPVIVIALSLGIFLLSASSTSLLGFKVVIPATIQGFTINSFYRLIDFIFGQGLNTVVGREIIGVSEIHILNHFFTAGAIIYFIMISIFFIIYYKYKSIILKYNLMYTIQNRHYFYAFFFFIFSLIIGSLHYDALFRYPSNVIILAMIGLISREISNFKHLKYQTNQNL
jgi:hypothetical protein